MLAALQAALAREPLIVAAAVTTPDQRVSAPGGAHPDPVSGSRQPGTHRTRPREPDPLEAGLADTSRPADAGDAEDDGAALLLPGRILRCR